MTTDALEKPDLGTPRGHYGERRMSHVKNLLARASYASSGHLTPELVKRMRRHYQVSSGLIVQSLPLIRADWSIECEDDRIREALTEAYRSIAFSVHRTMTRAMPHGYSPNTLTWDYREDLRGIYPTEVRDLEARTCKPALDDNGTLDGFVQTLGGTDETFDPIYTLWIVEGMESGNYYGRSILDAALDPYSDWAAFRAFHARYLERFGEPVVIARAPAGSSISNTAAIKAAIEANGSLAPGDLGYVAPPEPILEDNLDTALDMGENLRHHSVVALPSSLLFGADGKPSGYAWNLEFLEAKGGSGADFREGLNMCDRNIGRAMFVPDLLTQNTEDVGSNALGQTHKGVWTESVEGRLDDYSRQITEQVIERARVLNFGAGSAPARLVFAPLADAERDRLWALVVALVDNGDMTAVLDVRQLAEDNGVPVVDEATEIARRAAQAAATSTTAPAAADVTNDGQRPTGALEAHTRAAALFAAADPVAGLPDWKLPQSYDPPPYRRGLTTREERVGFAQLEDGMNRTEARIVEALTAILDTEHDRVLRQLTGIVKKDSPAAILEALGTLEIKGGPQIVKAWTDLMSEIATLATAGLREELTAYAETIPDPGPEARALFRAYAATSAERVLSGLLTEVRLELLNAATSGVSRAGMAAIVASVFDAYQGSEGKPIRLTTRMLSAKSLNYSRAAAVERAGIPLAGAQYSALLDRRTCELCDELDEQVIAITNTDLARFTPPVHHNCRCVWVWITRDEEDFTPTWSTPSRSKIERFGGLVF